jgi:hypothetical protein
VARYQQIPPAPVKNRKELATLQFAWGIGHKLLIYQPESRCNRLPDFFANQPKL